MENMIQEPNAVCWQVNFEKIKFTTNLIHLDNTEIQEEEIEVIETIRPSRSEVNLGST